jgi:hypothetical protein
MLYFLGIFKNSPSFKGKEPVKHGTAEEALAMTEFFFSETQVNYNRPFRNCIFVTI